MQIFSPYFLNWAIKDRVNFFQIDAAEITSQSVSFLWFTETGISLLLDLLVPPMISWKLFLIEFRWSLRDYFNQNFEVFKSMR